MWPRRLPSPAMLKWSLQVLSLAALLHVAGAQEEMGRHNFAPESSAAAWGAASFEALCRSGMPSSACDGIIGDREYSMPTEVSTKGVQEDGRPVLHSSSETAAPEPSTLNITPAVYTIAVPGHRQVAFSLLFSLFGV